MCFNRPDGTYTDLRRRASGHLVEGMPFHRFYFDLAQGRKDGGASPVNTTMSSPKVTLLGGGSVGIVAYIRLIQKVGEGGKPMTLAFEETRVWHKVEGTWKHVHFHRSAPNTHN
ncbi:Calcium/calmodulindependent protein kinase type II delta chain, putative [Acanthamoeba castellanii str. Neff]|uniref:Calcium/calmodulindependent protein kinase type II delta chain, putative n=1 Tax=Acanthamoeba castellanii (strain ATCC 30010 / Neff) TaxID=1257118 RepID=L8GMX3_ACACF|nr:Calcium/calmodulindependent protein kinase type II delta chain, putative [Acanthamoeba castellanii str. Neff]ELR14337.1 Calcium/calmodulindependent protein kinase type II delta chain, putative [Acanthamoeba castellanii str. Neff]